MSEFYVYLYTDPTTGDPMYVGKGKDSRALSHKFDKRSKSHFHRRLRKVQSAGFDPMPEYIATGCTNLGAYAIEKFWIAVYGRTIDGGTLLNMSDGGIGWASARRGKAYTGQHPLKGIPLTKEAIEKRTESRRKNGGFGKPLSQQAKDNIKASWAKRRLKYGQSGDNK